MKALCKFFATLWNAIRPDEATVTAGAMRFEGYTDFEIAEELRAITERTEKGHTHG
jgi:hypothetical protein